MKYPTFWPQFYAATILEWKPLLKQDKYKDVIIESCFSIIKIKMVNTSAVGETHNSGVSIVRSFYAFRSNANQGEKKIPKSLKSTQMN